MFREMSKTLKLVSKAQKMNKGGDQFALVNISTCRYF